MKFPRSWLLRFRNGIANLATIGVSESDSEDEKLRKSALTLVGALIPVAAVVWIVTYSVLGLYRSAALPFLYQLGSVASLLLLWRTKDFVSFRKIQLLLILVLPVLLQWSLGGFVASSGVMLWGFVAVLGAAVFAIRPIRWFIAFLMLAVLSGVIDPFLTPAPVPAPVAVTFFVLNICSVSGIVYFMLRYFMRGLEDERQKSERLLLNVLPAATARRLKAGEEPIADRFEDAVVVFADVVDFTPLSMHLAAEDVVRLLDSLFSAFDSLADRWGLEKIKTIGDAYMAVSGIPVPSSNALECAAEMALEMQQEASKLTRPLTLRIGLDVGPVLAGVIGKRRFLFDLWGDTVNRASRMESHGLPGTIQVTETVHERLHYRYVFEPRGLIEVKGNGTMSTYFMVGRKEGIDAIALPGS
ncbi:MAG: adenylate/guanylate cyclase domain-containing protein [Acidimicrobiia bacterium]